MVLLASVTLFVSAVLLFLVQPLFARMVLPLLGGSPAVWITCVVFFQAALLLGYAYAHASIAWLGPRRQTLLHLLILVVPFVVLPIAVPAMEAPDATASPLLWLLGLLCVHVGLPFFVVAATAPLVQRWFAATGHPAAKDPYYLYAASNLGSMLGLFGYPFVFEPLWTLREQSMLWLCGYAVLCVLLLACALQLLRAPALTVATEANTPLAPLAWRRKLRWVVLALVPSSLMLSVTTYLTTDVNAMPFLWVLPLALYLLTFILTFASRPPLRHEWLVRISPFVIVMVTLLQLIEASEPLGLVIVLHLLGLFVVGMVCHGELARDRPDARQLTEFYLWQALGGVLGGLCNAVLAPLLFPGVVEYPLMLVLAALLRPGDDQRFDWRRDLLPALAVGGLTALLVLLANASGAGSSDPAVGHAMLGVIFGVPLVVSYLLWERPLRFGLSIGALLLASLAAPTPHGQVVLRVRSFFGIYRVTHVKIVEGETTQQYMQLVHGNTTHGQQSMLRSRLDEPLTYYHTGSPIGRLFALLDEHNQTPKRVAVVGLGAGTLLAYGKPEQSWTFFEIDPLMVYLARDSGKFSYWQRSAADRQAPVLGDARLRLAQDKSAPYDLLIIDAFSSDAVPVHLLTKEAFAIYRQRLAKDGLLVLHISNRYLHLAPVVADLAADAKLLCRQGSDGGASHEGRYPSDWVVLGSPSSLVASLPAGYWQPLASSDGQYLWTDDFSSMWGVLRLRDVLVGPHGAAELLNRLLPK